MNRIEQIVAEIEDLFNEGLKILKNKEKWGSVVEYEKWYTKSLVVINQVAPERLNDFIACYKQNNRKKITYDTYTISDYNIGLIITRAGGAVFDTKTGYFQKFQIQIAILKSIAEVAPNVLRDIHASLQSEIIDNDINASKELFKAKYLRSSGVVCGVALESHLKMIAKRHNVKIHKKHPTISDLNDPLKENGVYDVIVWRLIQRLADIRNLCGHSKDREPTSDEIDDMIKGAEKNCKGDFLDAL